MLKVTCDCRGGGGEKGGRDGDGGRGGVCSRAEVVNCSAKKKKKKTRTGKQAAKFIIRTDNAALLLTLRLGKFLMFFENEKHTG